MVDEAKAVVFPLGLEDEYPGGPPTTVIEHKGARLVLRFAEDDVQGKGRLAEIRLLPLQGATLAPATVRAFAPGIEQYVTHARNSMRFIGSPKSREDFTKSAEALRRGSGPGRGLTHKFYKGIALEYAALIAEGTPFPVKTIAENHGKKIAAASKWIKEARRLFPEIVPPKGVKS